MHVFLFVYANGCFELTQISPKPRPTVLKPFDYIIRNAMYLDNILWLLRKHL